MKKPKTILDLDPNTLIAGVPAGFLTEAASLLAMTKLDLFTFVNISCTTLFMQCPDDMDTAKMLYDHLFEGLREGLKKETGIDPADDIGSPLGVMIICGADIEWVHRLSDHLGVPIQFHSETVENNKDMASRADNLVTRMVAATSGNLVPPPDDVSNLGNN